MPPGKGGNEKKEAGRARKADAQKKRAEEEFLRKEEAEAAKWVDKDVKGGKAAKLEKDEKRKVALARKAETSKLLAEEEAGAPSQVKSAPKAGDKKGSVPRPAGPGAIAAAGSKGKDKELERVESFSATGIDNALELLEVVTAKMDKASLGQQAAGIEKHPERRFKAAFEAYQERELPIIKQDHPGLRLQQYKELLYKQFQKSPENPFNQATVAYDASKEEKLEVLDRKRMEVEERLREKSIGGK